MSSYMLAPSQINALVGVLLEAQHPKQYPPRFPEIQYLVSDYKAELEFDDPVEFSQRLFELNFAGLKAAYPQLDEIPGPHVYEEFQKYPDFPPLAYYKLLACYLYQCDTSNAISKRPLYRALYDYYCHFAKHLLEETTEYKDLPWGHLQKEYA